VFASKIRYLSSNLLGRGDGTSTTVLETRIKMKQFYATPLEAAL
jgi:hypothetical protein